MNKPLSTVARANVSNHMGVRSGAGVLSRTPGEEALRDQFAMAALPGAMRMGLIYTEAIAGRAYAIADAMLLARKGAA